MSKGGSRPGAGRPTEEPKDTVIVRLSRDVAFALRSQVQTKFRSRFIQGLIVKELGLIAGSDSH